MLNNNFLSYCLLGLAAMAEGPITLLTGGAAISKGLLRPLPVYVSVVSGNLIADMGWYWLGRIGKMEWLSRAVKKVGINPLLILRLQEDIQTRAPRLLFFSKLSVGLPIPTLIATGLGRVPIKRWAVAWLSGELIKSAAIILVGYLYAETLQQASSQVQTVLWGITIVIVIAGLAWSKFHRKKTAIP